MLWVAHNEYAIEQQQILIIELWQWKHVAKIKCHLLYTGGLTIIVHSPTYQNHFYFTGCSQSIVLKFGGSQNVFFANKRKYAFTLCLDYKCLFKWPKMCSFFSIFWISLKAAIILPIVILCFVWNDIHKTIYAIQSHFGAIYQRLNFNTLISEHPV